MTPEEAYVREQEMLDERDAKEHPAAYIQFTPERWAELEHAYNTDADAAYRTWQDDPDEWHAFMLARKRRARATYRAELAAARRDRWYAERGTPDNYWHLGRHIDAALDEEADRRDREMVRDRGI